MELEIPADQLSNRGTSVNKGNGAGLFWLFFNSSKSKLFLAKVAHRAKSAISDDGIISRLNVRRFGKVLNIFKHKSIVTMIRVIKLAGAVFEVCGFAMR